MKHRLRFAAEEVHDVLGPGYTESVYHAALLRELSERSIPFHTEGTIPVMYKGAPVGRRRPDLFIVPRTGDKIVVELKAGSSSGEKQLLQYLDVLDENVVDDIAGGAVIRFNNDLAFWYTEV